MCCVIKFSLMKLSKSVSDTIDNDTRDFRRHSPCGALAPHFHSCESLNGALMNTVNTDSWSIVRVIKMKWNESGFRPPLCTYRLNWARRTSWGWWDDWDDTVLQTQDSKFDPWRSEAEHATSRSRRLPTILTFTRFFQTAETGNRTPDSGVKGSGANHYPRAPAHSEGDMRRENSLFFRVGRNLVSRKNSSFKIYEKSTKELCSAFHPFGDDITTPRNSPCPI